MSPQFWSHQNYLEVVGRDQIVLTHCLWIRDRCLIWDTTICDFLLPLTFWMHHCFHSQMEQNPKISAPLDATVLIQTLGHTSAVFSPAHYILCFVYSVFVLNHLHSCYACTLILLIPCSMLPSFLSSLFVFSRVTAHVSL